MTTHRADERVAPAGRARRRDALVPIAVAGSVPAGVAVGLVLSAADVAVWDVAAVGAPVVAVLAVLTAAVSALRSS